MHDLGRGQEQECDNANVRTQGIFGFGRDSFGFATEEYGEFGGYCRQDNVKDHLQFGDGKDPAVVGVGAVVVQGEIEVKGEDGGFGQTGNEEEHGDQGEESIGGGAGGGGGGCGGGGGGCG